MAVFLVIVSGCIQPSLGVSDGIRINSFGFDSPTISDKDQAELSIALENVGAFDSTDVNFFIYGYDTNVWESVSTDASMGSASADSWTIDNFQGYVMDTGQPGFSADYTQILKVTEGRVAKGITQSFGFNGRLCYDYETRAVAKVNAISLSQRRDEKGKGIFSDGGILVKNSFAPIQIDVKTKSPIVFYDANGGQEAEVVLIIRNAAGGYPASSGCSVEVDVANVNKLSGLEVSLDGDVLTCDQTYSFYDGQAVVYCSYTVSNSRPKGEYTLSVVAKYYYYYDVKASINVIGTSDNVVVTPSGGGGPTPAQKVYKGGTCEDLCKSVVPNPPANLKGLAVCSDTDVVNYPGTDVPVLLNSVNQYGTGIGNLVGQSSVSLEDLKLHDVTVDGIKLRSLPVSELNKAGISKQYTEKTFYVDSDGDGLPNEWEELFIGIDAGKKDSDGDSISDGAETCGECTSGSPCDSTKTFKANYDLKCKFGNGNDGLYLSKLTLGLTGSLNDAKVTSTANPTAHSISGTESVDGMKIVGIGDKTIAQMTAGSSNSKIKAITYIDVGKLDLRKMNVDIPSLFAKTKCKNTNTYNKDIYCGCVVDLGKGYGPYPAFESGTTTPCNTKCTNIGGGYEGGRCIALLDNDDGYRCSGSSLVIYRMKISTASEKYGCSTDCTCYDVLKTMSAAEKQLRCK